MASPIYLIDEVGRRLTDPVTGAFIIVGFLAGPNVDTTLTIGVPGKNYTRKEYEKFLGETRQQGLLAKNALKGMSELDIAERDLGHAEKAYWDGMFKSKDDLSIPLRAAQERVETIRVAEAKKKAMNEARAHWRDLVNKATKRR